MKLFRIQKNQRVLTLLVLVLGAGSLLLSAIPIANAKVCMDIADIPLDALTQAAPGMIMFVIDDSGSMDWSIMCPPAEEGSGVFNGKYYIFSDSNTSNDNLYNYSSLENSDSEMMWMSQWAGYNGLYYDPATEYTPWPRHPDADVNNPLSDPIGRSGVLGYNSSKAGYTLNMTETWHVWDDDIGVVVDNTDTTGFATTGSWLPSTSDPKYGANYLYASGGDEYRSATWTAIDLVDDIDYDVEVRWNANSTNRSETVYYRVYNESADPLDPENNKVAEDVVSQKVNPPNDDWYRIAANVRFPSGIGIVQIYEYTGASGLCADAVRFVPKENTVSDIYRRHYYVRSEDGYVYLVNLNHATSEIEYYKVYPKVYPINPSDDKREMVTAGMLHRVTTPPADIVTGRLYADECQNFANWYSFYRRRELTAKNAIANVIDKMEGVFTGLIYINNDSKDQRALPVGVKLDSGLEDETDTLLANLYGYVFEQKGTPLRSGFQKAGRFYQGAYLNSAPYIAETEQKYYPYFRPTKGGSCQQAFTIIFTDGYYYETDRPSGIYNADGDKNSDFDGPPFGDSYSYATLADVAMFYYENDLNSNLDDDINTSDLDPAPHQHMVTYTLAFGVTGSLNPDDYPYCPTGACPSWPDPEASDSGKIDDLYHAGVNGRGKYLAAGSTAELNQALEDLSNSIKYRLGSAASLATGSVQRTEGSVIYQGKYNSNDWSGQLLAWNLDLGTGAVGSGKWGFGATIPSWDARTILTSDGTNGYSFEAANLKTNQTTQLTAGGLGTAQEIVDYLRGDTSNTTLRYRSEPAGGGAPLGDIVHSAPTYFNGMVYVGANDGMLHAFDAETGVEQFAYVPNLVYDHLAELADPDYAHLYYVDNIATVANVNGLHLLVGALGKGGKGYFALDVTDPYNMDATDNFLWEFPSAPDDDMGYSFSQANIVNTRAKGHVVVFGNGYDSVNESAVLFILDALTGDEIARFDTKVTGCNGLSMPAVVDVELDGYADYIFAGDLRGNMWKIDVRSDDSSAWAFSYGDGSSPEPLITVRNAADQIQPITTAPEVMLDCLALRDARGMMVMFGTGQYLNKFDLDDHIVQSVYGIWDMGPIWEAIEDAATAKTKYLGIFQADRTLSNASATLIQQTFTNETDLWWTMTDNQPVWYNPKTNTGLHAGWYFDMPESDDGERIVQSPLLRLGSLVLVSTIPSSSPCDAGGRSSMYIVAPCTGGATGRPEFDVTENGKVEADDVLIEITGSPAPQGKKSDAILYGPLEIDDILYLVNPDGEIPEVPVVDIPEGMYYWRVLGD